MGKMKNTSVIQIGAVWLAVLCFCFPQAVLAASPVDSRSRNITDVALQDGGVFIGRVVDAQGRGMPELPVSFSGNNQTVRTTRTDSNGDFAFHQLRGGIYQVVAGGSHRTYRLWAPGTAPPASQPVGMVVAGETETVRGQFGGGVIPMVGGVLPACLPATLASPGVIAAITGVAASVPVSLLAAGEVHKPKSP